MKVAEVPITRAQLERQYRAGFPTLKISRLAIARDVRELVAAAAGWPVGTVFEKRSPADARAFQVRRKK